MSHLTFFDWLRSLIQQPTPVEVAARELAMAELSQLEHQSAAEFSQAMVAYQETRIKRLKSFLRSRASQEQAS